jgi:Pao retrotransposon peptidase./Integrase core domain.
MKGKLMFQAIFHTGKGWKDPLTKDELKEWLVWLNEIAAVATLSIPRWMGFSLKDPLALHVFSDASTVAYGAVGYFVLLDGRRVFVAAKGRVLSKKKPTTIPKAELQALLLGVRLMESIVEQLEGYAKIVRVVNWVDSAVVYCWMKNTDAEYKDFVANRVQEVLEAFGRLEELRPEVRWVPTEKNPADLISRGVGAMGMAENLQFWSTGPDFLSSAENEWPQFPKMCVDAEEELVKSRLVQAVLPPKTDYGAYEDLRHFLEGIRDEDCPVSMDMATEEELLVKEIQQESFANELQQLRGSRVKQAGMATRPSTAAGESSSGRTRKGSRDKQAGMATRPLSVFLRRGPLRGKEIFLDDNGFLRMVTRMIQAEWMSWAAKCPIVLAGKHAATRLLIREYHRRTGHEGSKTTFALMAKKYWLPKNAVKTEVYRCKKCREEHPLRMDAPVGVLHRFRLEARTSVFMRTGMDFFGPFITTGGRKMWGLLFTCLTVRAVHLELVPSQTVPSWLNAVDRFIARWGIPASISCDNGSTFVAGDKELAKMFRQQLDQRFQDEVTEAVQRSFCIQFCFIPVGTPHYGGLWERMVRQVQTSIMKAAGGVSRLSVDALRTLLARAEYAVNMRPLAIGDDHEVITPMSILAPASSHGYGFLSTIGVSRVVGQLRQAIDHFWRLWTTVYLHELSTQRVRKGSPEYVELRQGDVVLFERFEKFHRLPGRAPEVGTISQVFPSRDGVVRRYKVTDTSGRDVEVPTKRVFLAEQDLVEARRQAEGRVVPASGSA